MRSSDYLVFWPQNYYCLKMIPGHAATDVVVIPHPDEMHFATLMSLH